MIDLMNRLNRSRVLRWSVVASLFAFAFAVRAIKLSESRMIAEVQFRSALVARSYYFRMSDDIPEWRKEINTYSVDRLPGKEPHVMPFLAALLYKVTGGEQLWVGKLVATVAWLLGGFFLFLLLSELVAFGPALIVTSYFLFVPFGVHASTSFISDPLMIALFIVALYAIWRYYKQPSKKRLITSSICAGLAILVKPLVIFALLSVFIFMAIGRAVPGRGRWAWTRCSLSGLR